MWKCFKCFWRWLPDLLAVAFGLCLVPWQVSTTTTTDISTDLFILLPRLIVPMIFIMFLLVSMLQEGNDRKNISRIILESNVFMSLGYCSYPLYLLQLAAFNIWAPILAHAIQTGQLDLNYAPWVWFTLIEWYLKILAIVVLFLICWCIQKYFQDTLVARLFIKCLLVCEYCFGKKKTRDNDEGRDENDFDKGDWDYEGRGEKEHAPSFQLTSKI